MKLIDLLVKELPKRGGWPEGAEIAVQDADSQICFSSHSDVYTYECQTDWYGGDWGDGDWSNPFIDTIADDRHNSIVTRNQYESALAASKAIVGHEGWIQWAGGDCPVDSDAIVEVKFSNGELGTGVARADRYIWRHEIDDANIVAYRLHDQGINARANDDQLEQDLNECIGQDFDVVNHPSHYTQGDIECIDAIKAALGEEQYEGYLRGACIKYLWRYEEKGGLESVRKAQWYLNKLISELEDK